MTGDLGKIGLKILIAMFAQSGVKKEDLARFRDAGAEFLEKILRFWRVLAVLVVQQLFIAAI